MRVSILGGGAVGGGVIGMLRMHPNQFEIAYLVVRDMAKKRDLDIPESCFVTDDIEAAISDETVDTVIELMGGTTKAWEVVQSCLKRGINVITANKALISKYLPEIEEILRSQTNPPAFMYEAAVCGGIPVVNTFLRGMAGDEITSVFGVMNGSTNWMLDRMDREGVSYEPLLKEASELGYLEADPSADILGWDARSKLCILARIAFGTTLDESTVHCLGIHTVTQADIAYANSIGRKIKLLARSWKNNGVVHAFVVPAMIPAKSSVGSLQGSGNCVCFDTKYSGLHSLLGSGAGRYPTANSVVADILEVYKLKEQQGCKKFVNPFGTVKSNLNFDQDFSAKFYVRGDTASKLVDAGIDRLAVDDDVVVTGECSYKNLRDIIGNDATVMVVL